MATSPNHLPINSTTEREAIDCHLPTVQAAMIHQIAQATLGKIVLDDALHSIAQQLQHTLQVNGCFIVQSDDIQDQAATDNGGGGSVNSSKISLWLRAATAQPTSRSVPQERLYDICTHVYRYYQSRLVQGKSVIVPGTEQQLAPTIWDSAQECGLYEILIVPLLHSSSYLGGIILYRCESIGVDVGRLASMQVARSPSRREIPCASSKAGCDCHNQMQRSEYSVHHQRQWTEQEIAVVQTIADHCAIALTLSTLQQRSSTELQVSLARNQALLEAIPDAIFRITRDGIYLDRKAPKQNTLPIPEVAGLIWHHIEIALETNEMQIVEYQLWVNDKSRHFETRIVKSGTDEVAVIVQDITERVEVRYALEQLNDALEIRVAERTAALREANRILRAEIIERQKAEQQLKESEERFRNLIETSSDWVWEINENAIYTYASPKVRSLLGYEPSEILGKTPLDLMLPQERQRVADLVLPLAASRQPFTCIENTNIHKDGHSVVLERSGVPIFDAKGIFRGYRGIDRDITRRKKAEKEVQFLHSITRAIFESQDFHTALDVALQKVCEATGWDFGEAWVPSADGSILECSPAWYSKMPSLELFRSASERLTFLPNVGLPGRVWVSQQPEWRQNVSTEASEIYLRTQLAREVGLKAALGIPIIANEGVLAIVVFYMFESKEEDQRLIELISASTELGLMIQRKQAEGEIRKALEKEKELTELKSRFITMTSHEFRTPLTTIHSSAELLEHYSPKWTEEKKLTHLHRIQASVKHMTKLLNDVLILGKADAGKLTLNLVPLNLENFCRHIVEELQLNDNNQHTINLTCGWGLMKAGEGENFSTPSQDEKHPLTPSPRHPYMDEKLLWQILENLLSNAIKYSPTGSTIEFILNRREKHVVFQVRDRGLGIPSEDRQRLFETFHRATNVGTIAGTGLGLAIVKKCVDIHQGQIAVESEVGVGSTFTVTLPLYNLVSTHDDNFSN
jgi:PAS domain S-box-containing protein